MMVQSWQSYSDEAINYSVDYNVMIGRLSTTVSSVTWTVDGGTATITSEALASGIASALITTGSEGCSMIKLKAVLADGQTDVFFFKIETKDPNCTQSTSNRY